MRLVIRALESREFDLAETLLDQYVPTVEEPDIRGFEWHHLRRLSAPPVAQLPSHAAEVWGLDVSPSGEYAASGDINGEIRISELPSGRLVKTLKYCDVELNAIRFSPDGKWLATAGQDRTVRVWTVGDWQPAATLPGHNGTIYGLAWSPDSKLLASAGLGDFTACIWDIAQKSLLHSLVHPDQARSIDWSPQGNLLAVAYGDAGVQLWDTSSWQKQRLLSQSSKPAQLYSVRFSPSGALVVVAWGTPPDSGSLMSRKGPKWP